MSSETQLSPYEKIGKNWFFIPQLAPMQVDKKIIDLPSMQITNQLKNLKIQNTNEELQDLISSLHNSIEIFYFRIKYFRDADRNEYNKNCVYFLDKGELVDEKIIKNKSYYNKMMEQSRRFLEGMDKLPYFKR
ncbi:MAG: hypothetical protein HS130_04520 [Deltaproteobacteria bacterium]|nr:hypothetical protein [Deltaproteobacteria bacterium]